MTTEFIPDLKGVSLLICTPCGDGKYERKYLLSLVNTLNELKRLGAKFSFADLPYCSDIALARCKLLGTFYRSEHTHMMFVDSDMGWEPQDVVRLILMKEDFIGAAGPKKKYPIEFAASMSDEYGNRLPVLQDDSIMVQVSEVGMAFMLFTRNCIERMIAGYPDLEFVGDKKQPEYALFDPIVCNGRRLSEDFAFCNRWRKIGGKVKLIPDIRMTHTGIHTFEGALIDTAHRIENDEKA